MNFGLEGPERLKTGLVETLVDYLVFQEILSSALGYYDETVQKGFQCETLFFPEVLLLDGLDDQFLLQGVQVLTVRLGP